MSWVETASEHFLARHDLRDDDDVVELLELLESTRDRLVAVFPTVPEDIDVVVHGSWTQLVVAQPVVAPMTRVTAPAARRYLGGWCTSETVHVLAPRLLRARASNVPGSREMAVLTPAALYAQLVMGYNNARLPPPWRPGAIRRAARWAWLAFGAPQWFSGQTAYLRPAIARRLHEGGAPAFPPSLRDAVLLGGTVLDLLAREEGTQAAVELACRPPEGTARQVLVDAFAGRPLRHTESAWRSHLHRLAGTPTRS